MLLLQFLYACICIFVYGLPHVCLSVCLCVIVHAVAHILICIRAHVAEVHKPYPNVNCIMLDRKGMSTEQAVLGIRRLIQMAIDQKLQIYLVFVDLRKAFDSLPRNAVF